MAKKVRRFELVQRIVYPKKAYGGCLWEERWVVARVGDSELWWVRSSKTYYPLCCEYNPAHLTFAAKVRDGASTANNIIGTKIFEGGRLTRARLRAHADKIDSLFGLPGLAGLLDPRFTLVNGRHGGRFVPLCVE